MKRVVFYLIFAVIFVFTLSAQPKREIRGVWLTINYALDWPKNPVRSLSDIEQQKADLDRMLDKFEEIGINVIFFQTRLRGNVIYPSEIEPVSQYFNSKYPDYDPLAYAIEACRQRKMECHAWMVVYPVGSSTRRRYAVPVPKRYQGMARSYNGSLYLDPGNPQATDYLLCLIREIVSKYDVDGIHFDYVRYPNGSGKFPDENTYKLYGQGKDRADWRRENINRFVYAAYDEVKSLKPWV
ncbi:MAG: family 10 glycosylhydrolase, partial [Candidatus Symbiothrix sp.]|nr:family 10 glycosylhydrolase [Candidatus Symbiothrix sp.]